LFPNLAPNYHTTRGMMSSDAIYRIDLAGPVSIRDILIRSAEQTHVMWRAVIQEAPPTYMLEDKSTGSPAAVSRASTPGRAPPAHTSPPGMA